MSFAFFSPQITELAWYKEGGQLVNIRTGRFKITTSKSGAKFKSKLMIGKMTKYDSGVYRFVAGTGDVSAEVSRKVVVS